MSGSTLAPLPQVKDHAVASLRDHFSAAGIEPYRAEQVAAWVYGRGVEDPLAMTDLSEPLRQRLAREWSFRALELEEAQHAADGTVKGTLRCADGALIEAVLIPEGDRTTLCVSTQVGCALACSFCATGALGFTRNLTTAEIVDQLCRMRELLPAERRVTNVVYMGMGEPLLNLRAVLESIRIFQHPRGLAFGPRRITVSTSGVVPRIRDLLDAVPVNLAVSLHATTDAVRDQLVPLNRRFPLDVLMEALRGLPGLSARHPVFFEYTLMAGINDDLADARRLVALLRGLPSKVNLIPMNPHEDATERPPSEGVIDAFAGELVRGGLTVTLRRPRGSDIDAACGQLAVRGRSRAAAPQSR